MKRVTVMITLALLVGGALKASSGPSIAFSSGAYASSGGGAAAASDDRPRINREFRASMGQKLEVELDTGGSVEVIGWDRELISVDVYKGGRDAADCRIDFQETASGLRITSEYEGKNRSYSTSISFVVRVPRRFDIEFDSMGGGLNVCGVEGRISGKTMGGDLTLNNLKGDVSLQTMGGAITLSNSEVEGRVATMGGEVLIENVVGDVRGSTMGGDVVRRNTGNRAGRTPETQCATTRRSEI